MQINQQQCAELLLAHDEFTVLSHEHPDGDTLGCAFALCAALKALGKKREFRCGDAVPHDFSFLTDGFQNDAVQHPYVVAVDVADIGLLGSLQAEYADKIDLCIDHHPSNTLFAKDTLLEERAAAAEILYELMPLLGVEPDRYIRECIYTGVSTDTGCFRYTNTTPASFRIAAELTEKGIDSRTINKLMFETRTKSFLALELMARKTLEYHFDGRCAIITVTNDMFRESGADESECTPITALPRQIEGVQVGAVFKQKPDGTFNISVRTDGVIDASVICQKLGGGGHRGAAGCSVGDYEDGKARLLAAIAVALNAQ